LSSLGRHWPLVLQLLYEDDNVASLNQNGHAV